MKRFHVPIFWRVRPSGYGFGGRAIDRDGEGGLLVGVVTRWPKTKKIGEAQGWRATYNAAASYFFPARFRPTAHRPKASAAHHSPRWGNGALRRAARDPPGQARPKGEGTRGNGTRKPPPGDPALGRKGGKRG